MSTHPAPTTRPAGRSRLLLVVALLLLTLAGLGCANTGSAVATPVVAAPHCPLHDDPVAVAPVAAPAPARPGWCGDAPGTAPAIGALVLAPVRLTTATRRGTRLPDGRRLLLLLRVSRR
ncbi:hypothetical protein [Pseudonocardia sp.]|uniref:hypothetical protein n=1 Tax=Pseudonocardia sp. TaxID=60912 RepID=UPI003D0A284D